MKNPRRILRRLIADERGMETIEWTVMAALIAIMLIGVVTGLGLNIAAKFEILATATKSPSP